MRTRVKFSLILTLMAVMIFSTFGLLMSTNVTEFASADVSVPTTATELTSANDGFYMQEGASVRTVGSGIKFTAYVTKDFVEENPGTFFAVLSGANGKGATAKEFARQPVFEEGTNAETFALNIYVDYTSYVEANQDKTDLAYTTELYASAYLMKEDGSCIKAYEPEDNQRSMRQVATDTFVAAMEFANESDDPEVVEDQKALAQSVVKYLAQNSTDEELAYVLPDGTGKINFPATNENQSYVGVYVEGQTANVLGENNVINVGTDYLSGKKAGDTASISAITSDGAFVTRTMVYADVALTQENFGLLYTLVNPNDATESWRGKYFVLTEDVDMSATLSDGTSTWNTTWATPNTIKFYGVLNGLGHIISNFNPQGTNGGLFGTLYSTDGGVNSGILKNIIIRNPKPGWNSGIVAGMLGDNSKSDKLTNPRAYLSNVLIDVGGANKGLLCRTNAGVEMENVLIKCNENVSTVSGEWSMYIKMANTYIINSQATAPALYGSLSTIQETDLDLNQTYYADTAAFAAEMNTNGASSFLKNAYKKIYG